MSNNAYPVERAGFSAGTTLTTTAIPITLASAANAYYVGGAINVTANTSQVQVKAYAFLDAGQVIKSGALPLNTYEATNVVTLVTIAATSAGGVGFSLVGQVGGVKTATHPQVFPYGIQFTVTTSSVTPTPGTFGGMVVAAPAVSR